VTTPFKTLPSLEQVSQKVLAVHSEVRQLAQVVGQRVAEHEQVVRENAELTDAVLEEINLKLAFLMSHITVRRTLNGGIAGPDGRVQVESKPAMLVYMEMRPSLVAQREEFLRVQSLQAEQGTPGSAPDADEALEGVLTGADRPGHDPITH
jgi:hypothetical protein